MTATADFLAALVRTESTPGREQEAIALAAAEMTGLGYDEVTVDGHGNLLGRIGHNPGDGRPVLVLDGHIDTIPLYAAEQWGPPRVRGPGIRRALYGLGAVDMKAGVAALIHGAAQVTRRDRMHGCAVVSVSIAEEMREGATLARTFAGRDVAWCVIAEPTDLRVATAQRGRARVEVEIWGRSAHAASSGQGVNAVTATMEVAARGGPAGQPGSPVAGPPRHLPDRHPLRAVPERVDDPRLLRCPVRRPVLARGDPRQHPWPAWRAGAGGRAGAGPDGPQQVPHLPR